MAPPDVGFATTPNYSATLEHETVRAVSGLFKTRGLAEKAVDAIEKLGYDRHSFNVIMSNETRDRDFKGDHVEAETPNFFIENREHNREDVTTELGNKALEYGGIGGALGGAIGAILAAVVTMGTTLAIPGLGIVVAGPILAGLAGAAAGGFTGEVVGSLVGLGIPEERVKEYTLGLSEGDIFLSFIPNSNADGETIAQEWETIGGANVHR